MKCRICDKKCDGKSVIENYRYEGGPFVVCPPCKKDYEAHNIGKISRRIEKNPNYDIEKHERIK